MTKEEIGELIDSKKFRLELLNGMPFGSADRYLDEHMEDIRSVLKLCGQYESCSQQEDN